MIFDNNDIKNKASFKKAVLDMFKDQYFTSIKEYDIDPEDESGCISKEYWPKYKKVFDKLFKDIGSAIDSVPNSAYPVNESDLDLLWIETSDLFEERDESFSADLTMIVNNFIESLNNLSNLNEKVSIKPYKSVYT